MENMQANVDKRGMTKHHDGITIGGRRETDLRFADDTTLLCTSKEELLGLLKKVKEASMSQNILLNTQKTNIMLVDKGRERKEDFVLDGRENRRSGKFCLPRIPYQHQRR